MICLKAGHLKTTTTEMKTPTTSTTTQAREKMRIKSCPCCGSSASPTDINENGFAIRCSNGCFVVKSNDLADAISLWNAPRFTDK